MQNSKDIEASVTESKLYVEDALGLFSLLPREIHLMLLHQYLSRSSIINLMRTSKLFFKLVIDDEVTQKNHFPYLSLPLAESLVEALKTINQMNPIRRILGHCALAEWDHARALWEDDPMLLSCKGTLFHPNLTYVDGQDPIPIPFEKNPGRCELKGLTPWMMAFINEEYDILAEMNRFMPEQEQKKQFDEIFPDGKIKDYRFNLKVVEKLLYDLFHALLSDGTLEDRELDVMQQRTRDTLLKFYQYIKPIKHQKGLVFDPHIYLLTLSYYDKFRDEFAPRSNYVPRYKDPMCIRVFWCVRVEEYTANLLQSIDLRKHTQGLGEDDTLKSGCVTKENEPFFPFRSPKHLIPGYDYCMTFWGHKHLVKDYGAYRSEELSFHGTFKRRVEARLKNRKLYEEKYGAASMEAKPNSAKPLPHFGSGSPFISASPATEDLYADSPAATLG